MSFNSRNDVGQYWSLIEICIFTYMGHRPRATKTQLKKACFAAAPKKKQTEEKFKKVAQFTSGGVLMFLS